MCRIAATLLTGILGMPAARAAPWDSYQIILWQPPPPATLPALRRLGVTAGMVLGVRDGPLTDQAVAQAEAPLRAAGLGSYIENIATDFYAPYHRWTPGHPVTWRFDQAHAALAAGDPTAFWRTPSLSDPEWLARIAARLRRHVRLFGPYHPLFYSLGDETGIADLAAAWDFDRAPVALDRFRQWLRARYRALPALNQEWHSDFASWDAVQPMTTDAAIARPDEDFAAWGDFKAWMDVAFANAVGAGTAAVHAADLSALAGIEGAQPPGWGGYDYARLAPAVNVMELYDRGDNIALARAFNPRLVMLTTIDASEGAAAAHQIWHDLLRGARGLVIWDARGELAGAAGRALAPTFAAVRGPVGSRLLAAQPDFDPVAILYSQPSFRLRWLLDRRADHRPWTERGSEAEWNDNNAWRASLHDAASALTHAGLQPRFLSEAMVAAGWLRRDRIRLLILPQTIALSPETAAVLRIFVAAGGLVVTDTEPGQFDDHGRRLPTPLLRGVPLRQVDRFSPETLSPLWRDAGISPGVRLEAPDGTPATDVTVYRFRDGPDMLLGLQRDPAPSGAPEHLDLLFDRPTQVQPLAQDAPTRPVSRLPVDLDNAVPTLLRLTPAGPHRE